MADVLASPAGTSFENAGALKPYSLSAFTPNDGLPDVTVTWQADEFPFNRSETLESAAWWKFTAPKDGRVSFDGNALVRAYTGSTVENLAPVDGATQWATADGGGVAIDVNAGATYRIAMYAYGDYTYRLRVSTVGYLSEWRQPPNKPLVWSYQAEPDPNHPGGITADPGCYGTNDNGVSFHGRCSIIREAPYWPHFKDYYWHDEEGELQHTQGYEPEASGQAYSLAAIMRYPFADHSGSPGDTYRWSDQGPDQPVYPKVPIVSEGQAGGEFSGLAPGPTVGMRVETTAYVPGTTPDKALGGTGSGVYTARVWGTTSIVSLHNFLNRAGADAMGGYGEQDAADNPQAPNGDGNPYVRYEQPTGTLVGLEIRPFTMGDGDAVPVRWTVWGPQFREEFIYNYEPGHEIDPNTGETFSPPNKWGPNRIVKGWLLDEDGQMRLKRDLDRTDMRGTPMSKSTGATFFGSENAVNLDALLYFGGVRVNEEFGSNSRIVAESAWTTVPSSEVTAALDYEEQFPLDYPEETNIGGFCAVGLDRRTVVGGFPEEFHIDNVFESEIRSSVRGGVQLAYRTTITPSRYQLAYDGTLPDWDAPVATTISAGLSGELLDTGARYE